MNWAKRFSKVLRTAWLLWGPVLFAACGGSDPALTGGTWEEEPTVPATFQVRPGVEQVSVTGADPSVPLTLVRVGQGRLVTLVTDSLGQASFNFVPAEHGAYATGPGAPVPPGPLRTLKAGTYVIRNESVAPVESTEPFRVLHRDDVPPESFYEDQELLEGFQYLEVRDGTRLSVAVHFPDPLLAGPPPWPTVVEYSGYDPSNPGSPEPGMVIARQFGYAVVGVNVRGTGCSGGVFDPFSTAQQADGYDVIEVVARQPWVLHNRVGMVGLSFPGIMELYTACTQPPHLAAVAPQSVIEDPWRQQWPGGVYNQGFTRSWLANVDGSAAPYGRRWVRERVEAGDTVCEANQDLRYQNIPFEPLARTMPFYPPDADDRRLSLLVRDVQVPVFLTGAWQDEQTGPRFATLLDDFWSTDRVKFTMYNGQHPDGYSPLVLTRLWNPGPGSSCRAPTGRGSRRGFPPGLPRTPGRRSGTWARTAACWRSRRRRTACRATGTTLMPGGSPTTPVATGPSRSWRPTGPRVRRVRCSPTSRNPWSRTWWRRATADTPRSGSQRTRPMLQWR